MAPKKTLAVVEVTVMPGGNLLEPEPFECHSACGVLLVITNTDSANTYYVGINTADTIYVADYDPANPATSKDPFDPPGKTYVKQVKPLETDTIKLKLLPKGKFGKAQALLYTGYKYTLISADNQQLTVNPRPLDPGFVITPP